MTLEICITSGQADQRLRDATNALANLREDYATELAALDRRIADLLPRATVDQSRKPELAEAISERDGFLAAERKLQEERASLKEQITHYTRQVEILKQQERANVISDADQRLAQALADHRAIIRQLVAAHRAVLNIARQNQGIPGANSMLPDGFHKLHLPNTVPLSWQGCTGEVMRDGLLPLEQDAIDAEKRRERDLARIAA